MLSRETINEKLKLLLKKLDDTFDLNSLHKQIEQWKLHLDALIQKKEQARRGLTARLRLPKNTDTQLKALDTQIQTAQQRYKRNQFIAQQLQRTYHSLANFQTELNSSDHSLDQTKLQSMKAQLEEISKLFSHLYNLNNKALDKTADATFKIADNLLIQSLLDNVNQPLTHEDEAKAWEITINGISGSAANPVTATIVMPPPAANYALTITQSSQTNNIPVTFLDLSALEEEEKIEAELGQTFFMLENLLNTERETQLIETVTDSPILTNLHKLKQALQQAMQAIHINIAEFKDNEQLLQQDAASLEKRISQLKLEDLLYDQTFDAETLEQDKQAIVIYNEDLQELNQRIADLTLQIRHLDQITEDIKPYLNIDSFDHNKWLTHIQNLIVETQYLTDFDNLAFGNAAVKKSFQMLGLMHSWLVNANIAIVPSNVPFDPRQMSVLRYTTQQIDTKVKKMTEQLLAEEKLTALDEELFAALSLVNLRLKNIIDYGQLLPFNYKQALINEICIDNDANFWLGIFTWVNKWNLAVTQFKPSRELNLGQTNTEDNLPEEVQPGFFSRNKFTILNALGGIIAGAVFGIITLGIATLSLIITCGLYALGSGIVAGICGWAVDSARAAKKIETSKSDNQDNQQAVTQVSTLGPVDEMRIQRKSGASIDVKVSQSRYALNHHGKKKAVPNDILDVRPVSGLRK